MTYAWVLILSIWGGVVSFWRKCREGHTRCFNIVEFVGEIATSILVGLITFWMAESAHIHQVTTAALVAVSGHMGSRLLFKVETYIEARLKRFEPGE